MTLDRREFLFSSGLLSSCFLFGTDLESKISVNEETKEISESWIEIEAESIRWNLRKVRETSHVPVMAVIKANAYGHGLIPFASCLQDYGIEACMVGCLREAQSLRKNGIEVPILNFGPFLPGTEDLIIRDDISQSVFSEDVILLNKAAAKAGRKAKVHIHVDTGMGRMGIPYDLAVSYIQRVSELKAVQIQGISSTFTEDQGFDKVQFRRFRQIEEESAGRGIYLGKRHIASSAGTLSFPSARADMVRPGILLYGYYPSDQTQKEDRLKLRPVLRFKSRVASVKVLNPGDSVSYHRVYTAKKKEQIAVIPVGYSDGYPYNIVGKGSILINGIPMPIIGDITANHVEVRIPSSVRVRKGDEAVLIGTQGDERITAFQLAEWSGISVYKILIGLNPLLPRRLV